MPFDESFQPLRMSLSTTTPPVPDAVTPVCANFTVVLVTAVTVKVPLKAALELPVIVIESPTAQVCAVVVVTVTTLLLRAIVEIERVLSAPFLSSHPIAAPGAARSKLQSPLCESQFHSPRTVTVVVPPPLSCFDATMVFGIGFPAS